MTSKSRLTLWLLTSTLSLALAPLAQASDIRQSGAVLSVSANFRPSFRFNFQGPDTLSLTSEDIVRGYVDVNADDEFSYQTNNPSGILLFVEALGPMIASARVTVAGVAVEVGPAGGFKTLAPGAGNRAVAGAVHFRLALASDAVAGTYAWPVRLSARMTSRNSLSRS